MARQYQNIISFVEPFGFSVLTNKKDYCELPQEERVIVFKCSKGHEMKLGHAVFINKKSKFVRENLDMNNFCSVCVSLQNKYESEEKFRNDIEESTGHDIEESTGHDIIELDNKTREVIYICGNCGEKNHSFIQSMKVNKGCCHYCQNDQFKLDYEDVKNRLEERGLLLLTKQNEYKNNKQKLKFVCSCGNNHESILIDITRGKLCQQCKVNKYKATCLKNYGEDNVSKVYDIFSKIILHSFSHKRIILPNTGRELIVMGYEPHAIMFLLQQGIDPILNKKIEEDDIIVGKDVPRFRYEMDDGSKHIYFPDILIRDSNLIIEVKSIYTFRYHVRINYLKFRKVVEDGYSLRLLMFQGYKMNLTDITCTTLEDVEQILAL
jgi:hypothetical protein